MIFMQQPKALTPLFLTELWERFGLYIIEGLMVLFLTQALHYTDQSAYTLFGEFSALLYMTPLIGGWVAGRVIGYRYAVMLGAVLLFIGYACITTTNALWLPIGLAIVALGTGFLKPNVSSYLGEFYLPNDVRRESGFTIFYMGINLGVFLATISSGYIQQKFGWQISFAVAAAGILIAILTFRLGFKRFGQKGLPIPKDQLKSNIARILSNKAMLALTLLVLILISYGLLKFAKIGETLQYLSGIAILVGLFISSKKFDTQNRHRFYLLVILMLASIFFWSIYLQAFFSANLFVDRCINRNIFGHVIPPPVFLAIIPILILLLGSWFAKLWETLNKRQLNTFIATKFILALFFAGFSMLILHVSTYFAQASGGLINPLWIVASYFVLTLGEMCLSPIGLSMITELSPRQWIGLMMGLWFMTLGYGGSLAGLLAQKASVPTGATLEQAIAIFGHAFLKYAIFALAVGFILLLINPLLKKLVR
jgi:POT family proton-dependent oligopeptide transporter